MVKTSAGCVNRTFIPNTHQNWNLERRRQANINILDPKFIEKFVKNVQLFWKHPARMMPEPNRYDFCNSALTSYQ